MFRSLNDILLVLNEQILCCTAYGVCMESRKSTCHKRRQNIRRHPHQRSQAVKITDTKHVTGWLGKCRSVCETYISTRTPRWQHCRTWINNTVYGTDVTMEPASQDKDHPGSTDGPQYTKTSLSVHTTAAHQSSAETHSVVDITPSLLSPASDLNKDNTEKCAKSDSADERMIPKGATADRLYDIDLQGRQSIRPSTSQEHLEPGNHDKPSTSVDAPTGNVAPDIGNPSKPLYKSIPEQENVVAGCAENTWTEERRIERSKRIKVSKLLKDIAPHQWPIVYSSSYNIGFLGLEKLHIFDSRKWGRIFDMLKGENMLNENTIVSPIEATRDDLLIVHSERYLTTLKSSGTVARITEISPVSLLPNSWVDRQVLKPLRIQTGGTILAAKIAHERNWAINIGGGFHHCCAEMGGGFCAYADITLAIKFLFEQNPKVKKAMIIDLDAHQGNGHERDFMDDDRVYIMDMYNAEIYPKDGYAKGAIKKKVELRCGVGDDEYLMLLQKNLDEALQEFCPDIVIYNAGTDILQDDPLGKMKISPKAVIERDEMVFQKVKEKSVPIVMVTSGGYQWSTAEVVAKSIINLWHKGLINHKDYCVGKSSVTPSGQQCNRDDPQCVCS